MSLKERKLLKRIKKENSRKKVRLNNNSSETEDDSEHELYYYADDRVRLMKEILKTLKTQKIRSLTPDTLKNFDMEEIKTMLLEELLGISKKRLKKIFEGQNADDESSSTEEEQTFVDVISLDDISDDDDLYFVDEPPNENNVKPEKTKRKHKVKKEDKDVGSESLTGNNKLLSVLELLELQARARAIRSQLAIEAENKSKSNDHIEANSDDSDVIVESPKVNEIVISSSESDKEDGNGKRRKSQKIKIIRDRHVNSEPNTTQYIETESSLIQDTSTVNRNDKSCDINEDVINLDVVEIEGIDDC